MTYNDGFKKEIVKKMLVPGTNISQLSRDIGVKTNILYYWKNKFANPDSIKDGNKVPRNWKTVDKIKAVLEYGKLSEQESGHWLRKNGLKSDHLKIWEKEFIEVATSNKLKDENKRLKKDVIVLEKELRRKEKALAEVSALLVLKKKVNTLFSEEEEK